MCSSECMFYNCGCMVLDYQPENVRKHAVVLTVMHWSSSGQIEEDRCMYHSQNISAFSHVFRVLVIENGVSHMLQLA